MRLLTVILAAALLAPIVASAQIKQTPGSKILVTACDAHRHTAAEAHPWIDPYGAWHYHTFPYQDAFLTISYANQASINATEIDFGLVARGWLIAVARDVGAFSPGVAIDHEFVVSPEIFPIGTALPYCAVMRVKYADGSIWVNPTPPSS
ncbi:MAG TPA: hypothetical protein VNF68_02955 [Candidatus Baltobacteraceae bacterium]|nr:hypothetical protein [Candidatus Baltobacteraceae bacterium]